MSKKRHDPWYADVADSSHDPWYLADSSQWVSAIRLHMERKELRADIEKSKGDKK